MAAPPPFKVGEARVEPASSTIFVGGEARHVSPKSMDLLLCLAERAGDLVSAQELMDAVWGDTVVGDSSIYERIKELRRAFDDPPRDSKVLQTVPKRGYRLIAPVTNGPSARTRSKTRIVAYATTAAALFLAAALYLTDEREPADLADERAEPVIAVLPFDVLEANTDNAHLGEAIAEELIHQLSNSQNLRVIARTSSFAVKNLSGDVRDLARQLGASLVLEGSITGEPGARVRIIAQLIDAHSGQHIWSRAYNTASTTLHGVQQEIVSETRAHLPNAARHDPQQGPAPGSRAYDQFLLGKHFLNRRSTSRDADNAVHYFEQAVQADPNFARAYVGLAQAVFMQTGLQRVTDGEAFGPVPARAAALLDKALQLDPELADAKAMLGAKAMHEGNLDQAQELFEAARQTDNSLVDAVIGLARVHHRRERHDLALATTREALALDPLSPGLLFDMQSALRLNGKYQEAMTFAERAVALNPDASSPFFWLATYKTALGQPDAVIALLEPLIGDPRFEAEQPGIYGRLIRSYMDLTDFAQAAELAETAKRFGDRVFIELNLAQGVSTEQLIHEAPRTGVPYHSSLYESIIGHNDHALERYEYLRSKDRLDYLGHVYWGYHPAVHAARLQLEAGNAALGHRLLDEVREKIEPLLEDPQNRSGGYYVLASIAAIRGSVDTALRNLESARQNGWCRAWLAKIDPNLAPLRDHPEFLRKIAAVESAMAKRRERIGRIALRP